MNGSFRMEDHRVAAFKEEMEDIGTTFQEWFNTASEYKQANIQFYEHRD